MDWAMDSAVGRARPAASLGGPSPEDVPTPVLLTQLCQLGQARWMSRHGGLSIGAASVTLGTTPRMLRYRESLGLLPPTKEGPGRPAGAHRRFGEPELRAVSLALTIELR